MNIAQPFRRVRRLRPAGHSAWVEAMHQPVLVAVSLVASSITLYALARQFVASTLTAIGQGNVVQIVPLALVIAYVVAGSFAIEITLLTAASRLRMHALRHEWGWAALNASVLTLCVGVEGLMGVYVLSLIDAAELPPGVAAALAQLPVVLFFTRAFTPLICVVYLVAFVMPLILQPQDVRREVAAVTGSAMVAIVQRITWLTADLSVQQCLNLFAPLASIFSISAGHDTAKEDAEMETAMRALHDQLRLSDVDDATAASRRADAQMAPLIAAAGPSEAWRVAPAMPDPEPVPALTMTSTASPQSTVRRFPAPGSASYASTIYSQARLMLARGIPLTLHALASFTNQRVEDVEAAITQLREQRVSRLPTGAEPAPDPILSVI